MKLTLICCLVIKGIKNKQTPWPFSPQANYTDLATATWRNLVSTFVDRGMSRGQRGGSPTVVNLFSVSSTLNLYLKERSILRGDVEDAN
jgi:hypothetical protein